MERLNGVYEGRIVSLGNGNVTAFVPQVFGDTSVIISDFLGTPVVGFGWVTFQAGDPEFPVWMSGVGGGGDGGGGVGAAQHDEVWIGPDLPTDPELELWYDNDAVSSVNLHAAQVAFTPGGSISSGTVQSAVEEVAYDAQVALTNAQTPPGWAALPLVNGWAIYGAPYGLSGGYRKKGDEVTLRGLYSGGPATGIICTMPTGCRPIFEPIFTVACYFGTAEIRVNTSGQVSIASSLTGTNPTGWLSLSGITYAVT